MEHNKDLLSYPQPKMGHTKHVDEARLLHGVADKEGKILSSRILTCFVYEACINWQKSCFVLPVCACV